MDRTNKTWFAVSIIAVVFIILKAAGVITWSWEQALFPCVFAGIWLFVCDIWAPILGAWIDKITSGRGENDGS